jgi:deazaflavin-dependent oxidoreductase (nitroreductase family)
VPAFARAVTLAPVIPANDPDAPRSRAYRATAWLTGTRAGRRLAIELAARVDPWLLRRTNGRLSTTPHVRQVLLTVPGRRSGEPRTTPLLYFTQGDEVILVASSFGRDAHPAWYLNLRSHPEATLTSKGASARYVAREETDEAERERLLALAARMFSAYGGYVERTRRRIPVMRLTPLP